MTEDRYPTRAARQAYYDEKFDSYWLKYGWYRKATREQEKAQGRAWGIIIKLASWVNEIPE